MRRRHDRGRDRSEASAGRGIAAVSAAAPRRCGDGADAGHVRPEPLNLSKSFLHLQSVKQSAIFETHGFEHMECSITHDGQARVVIDPASLNTGIDLRNVRLQFLCFRTFRFPDAVTTAQIDTARRAVLSDGTSITYPLAFTIALHGITKAMETDVVITQVADNSVSVAVTKQILIPAADFGPLEGIDRLECENRLTTLSDAQAVCFASGSARISAKSAYAPGQFADFANRCQDVAISVAGHTGNTGNPGANLRLPPQRADAVSGTFSRAALRQTGCVPKASAIAIRSWPTTPPPTAHATVGSCSNSSV